MQDMEIRGAGNILGRDQSGHINLIGFELYSRLLKDAVLELRRRQANEPEPETEAEAEAIEPEVHIGFPAHIPPDYIPDVSERLLLYQRLVDLQDRQQGFSIAEEIEDRFGRLPKEVEHLVELMCFRALCRRALLSSANYKSGVLRLTFHPKAKLDPQRLLELVSKSSGKFKLRPDSVLLASVESSEIDSPDDFTRIVDRLLTDAGISH